MKRIFATQNSFGLLVLRVFTGIMFAAHGAQKLFGVWGGGGIDGFAAGLTQMGLPAPLLQAYLAAGSEFFGGLLLILGFLTRLAAIPLFVVMQVAIFKAHWANGFFLQNQGFEYPFVITGTLVALFSLGPGALSLDRKLTKTS